MNGQSRMSEPATSPDTGSAISSLGSVVGLSLFDWLDGQTPETFGPEVVPANRTRRPVKGSETTTPAISGPTSSASPASVALSASLASKLKARFGTDGSTVFVQTWKEKVTPAGRSYWAHTASVRRTSANDSSGLPINWPTPRTPTGGSESAERKQELGRAESGGGGTPLAGQAAQTLNGWATPRAEDADSSRKTVSLLTGWSTPASRDWKDTPGMATEAVNPDGSERTRLDQLPRQAALLAPWTTPVANDNGYPGPRRLKQDRQTRDPSVTGSYRTALHDQVGLTGPTPESSSAATAKPVLYRLNPFFSLWLMGYPVAWGFSGVRAMQSVRKRPRSSSKRTAKSEASEPTLEKS